MLALWLLGCIQDLDQIGGTGSIYTTKCTSDMDPTPRGYQATCSPPSCLDGYTDAGVSHVAVTLDPGRRLVGIAERACVQDLSLAAAQFEQPDPAEMSTPE
jgi:hypothetical protein